MDQRQQYTTAANSNADEIRSLRVEGLLPKMNAKYVFNCFNDNAEVVAATVLLNVQTGLREDYGFVEFTSHSMAEFILNSYNGDLMPNSSQRYCLKWDMDATGTRWRWDNAYECCSFFGYDDIGDELNAMRAIERYQHCIPFATENPAGGGQLHPEATYPNTPGDSGEADPNNTKNQPDQTQWKCDGGAGSMDSCKGLMHTHMHLTQDPNMYQGGYAGYQSYQQAGPSYTRKQNQPDQTQWNGGSGAGFMFIQKDITCPRLHLTQDPNLYHGGYTGYVNYQQYGLYPQHYYPPPYQPSYQQDQTEWTGGSYARTGMQLIQVPIQYYGGYAGYGNYLQPGAY